ncbi:uncharacterized protein LOC122821693 [Gambusia affinis]|uniref:uncharacterized protein LOC122821693 n=1 Tax=Gambusia affinis TaxID=33528 RepID=UPI001CDB975F|nr:uncharacterized protein LOC122821693 [Gambusia affinis]
MRTHWETVEALSGPDVNRPPHEFIKLHMKKDHLPTEPLPIKPGLELGVTSLQVDSQLLCRNWSRSPNLHEKESPRTEDRVMAPSGPVLLLLLFSFLACSLSVPPRSDLQGNRALQKRGQKLDTAKAAGEYLLKIVNAAKPFIALIEPAGKYLSAVIQLVGALSGKSPNKEVLDYLKKEFDNLNLKIDANRKAVEYAIQAMAYADMERTINDGWTRLQELLGKCDQPETCKTILKEYGEKFFKNAETTLYKLHDAIVGQGVYSSDYEKLLKEKVRCHEDQIKKFSAVNAALVFKAITMTHLYNTINNKETALQDDLVDKARDISVAMFHIHKNCISKPDEHVKLEIKEKIDESISRKSLAQNIMMYLTKTYDRYDWMVVAFLTKNSKGETFFTKWKNRHTLSGFTEVQKGKTSVAFAKQVKGNHNKAAEMIKVIKECYNEKQLCSNVKEKLDGCVTKTGEPKVIDMYSAIHAYIHKKHDAAAALEAEDIPSEGYFLPEEQQTLPYIYTGTCSISFLGSANILPYGRFRVLLKSDEELMNKSPCEGINCGGPDRGKCVEVKNARIGLCECEKKYYGENCEETIEEYKKKVFIKEIHKSSDSMG